MTQRIVDHSIPGLEQIAPHHRDRDECGDHRGEQRGAEEWREARYARMEEQGRAKRQPDRQGHTDRDEIKRIAECLPEQRRSQ